MALLAMALCGGRVLVHATVVVPGLPPGAEPNILDLPVGQYAHCLGHVETSGTAPTPTDDFVQGTNAVLQEVAGLAYDEYHQVLWYGSAVGLYKIDPKTCIMKKLLGQTYTGNADGDATVTTGASFRLLTSFAPLPNGKVVIGDFNCRLRLFDPFANTVSPLEGPGSNLGAVGGYDGGCMGQADATPLNTVGAPPGLSGGRMVTGNIRGAGYSKLDGRVYFNWFGNGDQRSEIWSMLLDGSDVLVVAARNTGVGGTGYMDIALDHSQPYVYAVTKNLLVHKISTVAPYAVLEIAALPYGSWSYGIDFAQNAAGRFGTVVVAAGNPWGQAAQSYMYALDRDGNAFGPGPGGGLLPWAPPEICPAMAGGVEDWTTDGCWNIGITASTPDGLLYAIWGRTVVERRGLFAYRVAPKASQISITEGAGILLQGASITMS